MKIIYVTHYSEMYGANRSLYDLIKGGLIKSKSFEPLVIVPKEGDITKMLREINVHYLVIPFFINVTSLSTNLFVSKIKGVIKHILNKRLLKKNLSRISAHDPYLIHSNSSVFYFGAHLAKAMKIPHIWHLREFLYEDYFCKYDMGERSFMSYLSKTDRIIAISEAIKERRCKNLARKCNVIYNGVVFQNENYVKKAGINGFQFGMVGIINPGKNQLEGIRAMKEIFRLFPYTRLRLYGHFSDKNYEKTIKDFINFENLKEYVFFEGYVKSPKEIFKQIDCLIHCAHNEAMGRVTVEAMSFGVPVIGYDGGGTGEILTDGVTGKLYKTEKDLQKSAEDLIIDKNLYERISFNGMRLVKEKFTIEKYVQNVFSLYKSVKNN